MGQEKTAALHGWAERQGLKKVTEVRCDKVTIGNPSGMAVPVVSIPFIFSHCFENDACCMLLLP